MNINKKSTSKNRSLIKFLVYLFAVMFIPLVILGSFVYVYSRNEYINSTTKYIQEQIDNVSYNIVKDIAQADGIKDNNKDNKYFYNSQIKENKGSIVYIQDEILEAVHTMPFSGDLAFFNLEENYIYSYSIQTIGEYLDTLSTASETFKNEAINQFNGFNTAVVSDLYDDYEYTWYISFFEEENGKSISGFIHYIPDDYLEQILSQVQFIGNSKTSIYINDTMVYTNNIDDLNAQGYELSSEFENVRIVYHIDEAILLDYFGKTINTLLIVAIFGVVIGAIIIYIQYKPIKNLGLLINNFVINSDESNFFTEINLVMNNLIERNHFIELDKNNALKLNEKMLRKNTLLTLISRNLEKRDTEDVEALNKSMQDSDTVSFLYNNYLCVVFHGVNLNFDSYYENDDLDFYSLEIEENDCTLLLISAKTNSFIAVEKLIQNLMNKTFMHDDLPLLVGIGRFTSKLHRIHSSYNNALVALDYCNSLNKNVVYFSEVNQIDIYSYSTCADIIKAFNIAIEKSDTESMLKLINDIKNISSTTQNMLALHSICLELVIKCEQSQNIAFYKKELENFKYSFFNNEQNNNSYKNGYLEFLDWVENEIDINITEDKITETEHTMKVHHSMNIDEIHDYINKNITNNDLCVTFVADHFATSGSNLSHFYKKHTGTTILDCINSTKMNFVKKMLTETDYSFSKICEMIGYYYPSNVIRKFKAIEGMTPSEYRKRNA